MNNEVGIFCFHYEVTGWKAEPMAILCHMICLYTITIRQAWQVKWRLNKVDRS